jgi:hypothetical protein
VAARWRRARGIVCPPPPLGPLDIGGRGAPLRLLQSTKAAAKGMARAAAMAWGGPRPAGPQNPNHGRLGLGPKAPPLFSLDGLLFQKRPIRCFPYF